MIIRIWLNIPFMNLAIKTLSTYLEFPIDTSVCEIHVAQSFICRNATIRSILKKKNWEARYSYNVNIIWCYRINILCTTPMHQCFLYGYWYCLTVEILHYVAMIFTASFETPFIWRCFRIHNNLSDVCFLN